jgi:hypothetical protein
MTSEALFIEYPHTIYVKILERGEWHKVQGFQFPVSKQEGIKVA